MIPQPKPPELWKYTFQFSDRSLAVHNVTQKHVLDDTIYLTSSNGIVTCIPPGYLWLVMAKQDAIE